MTPEESEAYKKFKLSQMTKISASGESVSGEEREVWVCSSGCLNEGGGAELLCATRQLAIEWLERCRRKAQTDADHMNAFRKERASEDHWAVSPIQSDGDRAWFQDNAFYWSIRLLPVLRNLSPESPDV